MTSNTDDQILTAQEAAALLRCSPDWLRRAVREGRSPVQALKLGSHLRFSRNAILDTLRQPQSTV